MDKNKGRFGIGKERVVSIESLSLCLLPFFFRVGLEKSDEIYRNCGVGLGLILGCFGGFW